MKPILYGLVTLISTAAMASAATYAGNGNTGFGGVVSSLDITDDGSTITFTLNRGAGSFNDSLVIYLDTASGGETTTSGYTDTGDPLRRAISGFDGTNRSSLSFPAGFDIDFAIGLDRTFGGLWDPANSASHGFVATGLGFDGSRSSTLSSYSMTYSLSALGLTPGQSFDFVATYLNNSNAFRSNEGVGDGLPGGNVGQSPATFTGFRTYTTVPEPTSAAFAMLAGLGLVARRRRD